MKSGKKNSDLAPQTYEYLLKMIRPGVEKIEFSNWDCLSYYQFTITHTNKFYLHLLALFLIKDFVSYKKKIALF